MRDYWCQRALWASRHQCQPPCPISLQLNMLNVNKRILNANEVNMSIDSIGYCGAPIWNPQNCHWGGSWHLAAVRYKCQSSLLRIVEAHAAHAPALDVFKKNKSRYMMLYVNMGDTEYPQIALFLKGTYMNIIWTYHTVNQCNASDVGVQQIHLRTHHRTLGFDWLWDRRSRVDCQALKIFRLQTLQTQKIHIKHTQSFQAGSFLIIRLSMIWIDLLRGSMIWMVNSSLTCFEWLIAHRMAGCLSPADHKWRIGTLSRPFTLQKATRPTPSGHKINASECWKNVSLDMAISHIASCSRYLSIWGSKRILTLTSTPLTAVFRLWRKFARSRCRQKSTCHDKPWPGDLTQHRISRHKDSRRSQRPAMGNVFQMVEKVISHQFKMVQGFDGTCGEYKVVQGGQTCQTIYRAFIRDLPSNAWSPYRRTSGFWTDWVAGDWNLRGRKYGYGLRLGYQWRLKIGRVLCSPFFKHPFLGLIVTM